MTIRIRLSMIIWTLALTNLQPQHQPFRSHFVLQHGDALISNDLVNNCAPVRRYFLLSVASSVLSLPPSSRNLRHFMPCFSVLFHIHFTSSLNPSTNKWPTHTHPAPSPPSHTRVCPCTELLKCGMVLGKPFYSLHSETQQVTDSYYYVCIYVYLRYRNTKEYGQLWRFSKRVPGSIWRP